MRKPMGTFIEKEQENCPYCHGIMDLLPAIPSHTRHLAIVEGENGKYAEVLYNKEGYVDWLIYIDYCPECGRRLSYAN